GRVPVPDAGSTPRHAGRISRDGDLDTPYLGRLNRRRRRIPAGRLDDLASAAPGHVGSHRQRRVHHLSTPREHRTAAGRERARLCAQRTQSLKRLAIIGAGSWGTALSIVLSPRFERIRVWVYEQDLAERMGASRENDVYLPGFLIPLNVEPVPEFAAALDGAEIVLGVMPSHRARA